MSQRDILRSIVADIFQILACVIALVILTLTLFGGETDAVHGTGWRFVAGLFIWATILQPRPKRAAA